MLRPRDLSALDTVPARATPAPRAGGAAPTAPTPAPAATPPAAAGRRLAWLDALRGIAVLAVVYEHLSGWIIPEVRDATRQWAHAGTFGVMLFFLVSGYIIPASLERRGNLREFWIGRLFRLYPAWIFVIGLAVGLAAVADPVRVPESVWERPTTLLLGHLTMLQESLQLPLIQDQFWTLTYEMIFYLLVSVLFVAGQHRRSAQAAILLAAVVAVAGGVLPSRLLSTSPHAVRDLVVLTALALIVGVAGLSSQRRVPTIAGAAVLAALVLVLLLLNSRNAAWEGLLILGVMFTGTAIYRADQRQTGWLPAALAATAVAAAGVIAVLAYGGMWFMVHLDTYSLERSWLGGMAAAGVVFAAGMLLRHRRVPGWLAWLGVISYSVYLVHIVVIRLSLPVLNQLRETPLITRLAVTVIFLAVLLVVSYLSYRLIEIPGQRVGRRITRALRGDSRAVTAA